MLDKILREFQEAYPGVVTTTIDCSKSTTPNPINTEHATAGWNVSGEIQLTGFVTKRRICNSLFPATVIEERYSKIQIQERLILVAIQRLSPHEKSFSENKDSSAKSSVLVAAIETLEYTLHPIVGSGNRVEKMIYVAKVDTSGYWATFLSEIALSTSSLKTLDPGRQKSISPAQVLVRGYLKAVREEAMAETSLISKLSLYVFARAQPQYLFAKSAKNSQKSILDDRNLVRWWKAMIGSVFSSMHASTVKDGSQWATKDASWLIPGIETERQALNIIKSVASTSSTTAISTAPFWRYGYANQGKSGLTARGSIPRFPDDPKSRMMTQSPAIQGGFVDLRTFWELLAIGEESGAGKITGYFCVVEEKQPGVNRGADKDVSVDATAAAVETLSTSAKSTTVTIGGESAAHAAVAKASVEKAKGSTSDYTRMINFLLDLDFSTFEKACKSSAEWKTHINGLISSPAVPDQNSRQHRWIERIESAVVVSVHECVTASALTSATIFSAPNSSPVKSESATAPINILNAGLIRQKPTATSNASVFPAPTGSSVVNTLGVGLIKRTAPAPSMSSPSSPSSVPVANVLSQSLIKRKAPVPVNVRAIKNATPSSEKDQNEDDNEHGPCRKKVALNKD